MFGTLPPYMSLLCYAKFNPLTILSSVIFLAYIFSVHIGMSAFLDLCHIFLTQGGLSGLVVSLGLTFWIGVGGILSDIQLPFLPHSTDGCPRLNQTCRYSNDTGPEYPNSTESNIQYAKHVKKIQSNLSLR